MPKPNHITYSALGCLKLDREDLKDNIKLFLDLNCYSNYHKDISISVIGQSYDFYPSMSIADI